MKIPVLTYHSTNINGNDYNNNDLIAFKEDLYFFMKHGIKVLSTYDLVDWIKGKLELDDKHKHVVLTFDDGCELDFYDWEHPTYGYQQSFYTSMKIYTDIHATSFVIASKDAREVLVDTCTAGYKLWGSQWWQEAEERTLISIENHSWDHLHTTLETVEQQNNQKGDFAKITNLNDADAQIKNASEYISSQIQEKPIQLFAYPYGHYNNYLVETYFPDEQNTIKAAFICDAIYTTKDTNIWKIPRFTCGLDWHTSDELKQLLLLL